MRGAHKREEGGRIMTKKEFVEGPLAETLRNAKLNVERLELSTDGNFVTIYYDAGGREQVNIECNSFGAIVMDVTKKALY